MSPEKLKDYSEHHAVTYHFPDAYAGSNTKIRDQLNNLILKSPQNWQTSVALPFFQIEGTVVEWSVTNGSNPQRNLDLAPHP